MEQVSPRQMAYLAELDREVERLYTPQLQSLRTDQKKEIILDFINKVIRKLSKKSKKNADILDKLKQEIVKVKEVESDVIIEKVFVASLLQTKGFKEYVAGIAKRLLAESPVYKEEAKAPLLLN